MPSRHACPRRRTPTLALHCPTASSACSTTSSASGAAYSSTSCTPPSRWSSYSSRDHNEIVLWYIKHRRVCVVSKKDDEYLSWSSKGKKVSAFKTRNVPPVRREVSAEQLEKERQENDPNNHRNRYMGVQHQGHKDGIQREKAPAKKNVHIPTAKEGQLAKIDKKLSPRMQLEMIVGIHLLALETFLRMNKTGWEEYIKIENNNGRTVVPLQEKDYKEDYVEQYDKLLSIVNNVTRPDGITNQLAMELKGLLISESQKLLNRPSPRDAILYMEIEDCIKSLQVLTATARNETKQTGPFLADRTQGSNAQLRLMRACLDAQEALF